MKRRNPARNPVEAYLRLSTCDVSDALDRLGLRGAPHGLVPLWPGCPRIAGPAMTMRLIATGPHSPVSGTLDAIAEARPGDVLVVDHGGRSDVNSWGGIASFTARKRRLAGVVLDGVTRDVDEIHAMRFPAYARGVIQQSVRGRCAFGGMGIEVRIGSVAVRRGDFVIADRNGVIVVAREQVEDVLAFAQECAERGRRVRAWIARGMDPREAHEKVRYDPLTASRIRAPGGTRRV